MPDTRYYRQVRPSPRGGNIPMSAYGVHRAGQSYREMGRAGEMLTDIGIQALAENRKTEYYDQLNSGKLTALTDFAEYKQKLVENADTSTYLPELEKLQDAIRQRVKFTNKDAQDAFELWYAQEILSQNSDVQGDKLRVDTRNFVKNFNLSVNTLSDLASQALDEPTYQQRVTDAMEYYGLRPNEKTGRPELIPDWDNPLLYSDEVRRKGFEAWKAGTDEVRQKNITRATEEEDERLFQMALEAVGREPEQVETIIELMEMDGEQQSALRREARVLESSQRAEDQREQNVAFAQTEAEAFKLYRENQLTHAWITQRFDAGDMDPRDRDIYTDALDKRAKAEIEYEEELQKIEDPYNREIFQQLQKAQTKSELTALEEKITDYSTSEQKLLSVSDAKNWMIKIEQKRDDLDDLGVRQYVARRRVIEQINNLREGIGDVQEVQRAIDDEVLVKENFTPETGRSLHAMADKAIDPKSFMNSPVAENARARLESFYDIGGFGEFDGDSIETNQKYQKILDDFDEYFSEPRTADEAQKYIDQIIEGAIAKPTDGFWNFIFNLSPAVSLYKLSTVPAKRRQLEATQRRSIVKEPLIPEGLTDIWDNLTVKQKQQAQAALQNGYTTEEIKTALGAQ